MLLLTLSHLVNVIVVTVVPTLIIMDIPAMTGRFGPDSGARRILTCLYITIAIASAVGLASQVAGYPALSIRIASVMFPMQIVYKVITLPAVGWANPVVKSNIVIAALHGVTLAMLIQAGLLAY